MKFQLHTIHTFSRFLQSSLGKTIKFSVWASDNGIPRLWSGTTINCSVTIIKGPAKDALTTVREKYIDV